MDHPLDPPLKHELYRFCQHTVDQRIAMITKGMADVRLALASEAKSTAGDKHETGRAMLQLERENLGRQLAEAEKAKALLAKVPSTVGTVAIGLGTLVRTEKAWYYLAISAGRYAHPHYAVYCISPASPIGKLLLGKTVGDAPLFNGKALKVMEIQ